MRDDDDGGPQAPPRLLPADGSGSRPPSEQPQQKKKFFVAPSDDEGAANNYAAGAAPSVKDAVSRITWDDFKRVHRQPCVRDSYLYAIGAGFALGGVKFVLGSGIPRACNWAVGGFVGTSIVAYETCQARRRKERDAMLKAAQIIAYKNAEREEKMREKREREEREMRDVEAELARRKRWYKFW